MNIYKYASAKHVCINLKQSQQLLYLEIKDDGVGFDTSNTNDCNGIGFENMKTRAISMNGKFCVESSPGNGVYIRIEIPV